MSVYAIHGWLWNKQCSKCWAKLWVQGWDPRSQSHSELSVHSHFLQHRHKRAAGSHLSFREIKLAPSRCCHGREHLLHLWHWHWWGKWYKHTHRFLSNQRKAWFSKSFNSDFSLVRNSAPSWFYSFLVHDRNVSPMYFTNSCRRCSQTSWHWQCFQRAPKKRRKICRKMGPVPNNLSASTPNQLATWKGPT